MSIVLVGSTSGSITLQEPAVAGTTVLDLPATSGTVATLTTPSFVSTIGVGGATPAASGAGITFPATQSASSDANTLDDYEEGTWTPTVVSGGGSITSYTSTGTYTKIGNIVTVGYIFQITNGGTATGSVSITNLPFQVASNSNLDYTGSSRETFNSGIWYFGVAEGGTFNSSIWNSTNGGISWATNSRYTISLTYRVA
jgi:hypothetical protein